MRRFSSVIFSTKNCQCWKCVNRLERGFTSSRGNRQTRQNTSTYLRPLSTYSAATNAIEHKIRKVSHKWTIQNEKKSAFKNAGTLYLLGYQQGVSRERPWSPNVGKKIQKKMFDLNEWIRLEERKSVEVAKISVNKFDRQNCSMLFHVDDKFHERHKYITRRKLFIWLFITE